MAEKKERFVVLLRKKVDGDGFRVKCMQMVIDFNSSEGNFHKISSIPQNQSLQNQRGPFLLVQTVQ